MGVGRDSKRESAEALCARYLKASRAEKGRMLDEVVEVTGYNRKYALGLLRTGEPMRPRGLRRSGRARTYGPALFVDRRRPFYNIGRRPELARLPGEELGEYLERRFRPGRRVRSDAVDLLITLAQGHPYRAQQLAYHAYELTPAEGWVGVSSYARRRRRRSTRPPPSSAPSSTG